MRNTRSARPNAGFTLIEILVALLLTGLVMTSVFGVLHDAMTARDHIHNVSQLQRTGPMILDLIESDLRSMAPFNVGERRVFNGRKNSINGADADVFDFVANRVATTDVLLNDGVLAAERALRAPLCEIGYRLKRNERNNKFIELWRREEQLLQDDPFSGGVYTRVYDKVTNFRVTYFSEPGSQARAEDHWNSEEAGTMPHRIKIEFELEIEPRVENSDQPSDFSRRRGFARVFNLDPDINRAFVANVRPRIPDVPKNDEQPGGGPGGGGPGGGIGGPGGAGIPGFGGGPGGGGKKPGGGANVPGFLNSGGNKPPGNPFGGNKPGGSTPIQIPKGAGGGIGPVGPK